MKKSFFIITLSFAVTFSCQPAEIRHTRTSRLRQLLHHDYLRSQTLRREHPEVAAFIAKRDPKLVDKTIKGKAKHWRKQLNQK